MHKRLKERLETRVNPCFQKNQFLFLLKIIFLYVLDRFDALISKIIFKNKKYYFDAFQHEKQLQPHSRTSPKTITLLL
jgi:hypothetical protein